MTESEPGVGAYYLQQQPGGRLRLVQYIGKQDGSFRFFILEKAGIGDPSDAEFYTFSLAGANLIRHVPHAETSAILRAFRPQL